MSKLGSSLVLSGTAYFVKTFRTLGLREFTVEGHDILLNALKEPQEGGTGVQASHVMDKGKGKAIHFPVMGKSAGSELSRKADGEVVGGKRKRRGIVTGTCLPHILLRCWGGRLMYSMQP